MAIRVTCPGCHKRFKVSDKFAGKTGPCPKCKTKIRVPTADDEVKLHGPEGFGAGVRGAVTTKLIFREEAKFNPVMAASLAVGALVVLIVTVVLGQAGFFQTGTVLKSAIGLLLISPPLVIAGYVIMRDEEDLDRYRKLDLYLRTGICSAIYMALWGVYAYIVGAGYLDSQFWLVLVIPAWLAAGGAVGMLCFEMDFGRGVFHFSLYLFITALLGGLAGMGWVWQIPDLPEPWEAASLACCLLVGCGSPASGAATRVR